MANTTTSRWQEWSRRLDMSKGEGGAAAQMTQPRRLSGWFAGGGGGSAGTCTRRAWRDSWRVDLPETNYHYRPAVAIRPP